MQQSKLELVKAINEGMKKRAEMWKEMEGMTNQEKREYLEKRWKERKPINHMEMEYPADDTEVFQP